jgi:hypothetical protein
MTFIHPLLLGGLLLVGIPILLHLTMRQKPKRLPFPAFRFLLQRRRANQRSLRLRHLLLLALRIGLIALMCMALARPRLFSEGLNLSTDRPRAVVMLLDTSPSMEYTAHGKTRLDEARQRAEEIIAELPSDSKVAILDSAELGGEWSANLDAARKRLAALKLRAANAPVTRQLDQAFRLLRDLQEEIDDTKEPMPRFVYVFSDRTTASWEPSVADSLHQPDGVNAVFVDVGIDPETVVDMAIVKVEPDLQIVPAGNAVQIKATVRSQGIEGENQLVCTFDNDARGEPKPIQLKAGESSIVTFERLTEEEGGTGSGLKPGWHQVTVRLGATDALPMNNVGFATFKVQERRKVLVIADHIGDAEAWQDYINRFVGRGDFQAFHCDPVQTQDCGSVLTNASRANYVAICLLNVAEPSSEMWEKLDRFVKAGGGLTIVPGGWKWDVKRPQYNDDAAAKELMPGSLDKDVVEEDKKKGTWREFASGGTSKHRLLEPFMRWKKYENILFFQELPWALHSWTVTPYEGKSQVIATYGDGRPALLERQVGEGRVLLFTTSFDQRRGNNRDANNYFENGDQSFFAVLVNVVMNYLAGGAKQANFNYLCGETITIDLGAPLWPLYSLNGPGLEGAGTIARAEDQQKLSISQAAAPGNFILFADDKDNKNDSKLRVAGSFSMSVRQDEWDMNQVPVETIEKLLGPGSVVPVKLGSNLSESLQGRWRQPLELFPYLMIFLLLALACENLLSNKFYRREPVQEERS